MSKGSSGIWSRAPTFSQAFPKSTFDELPPPSILPVPSGAEQSVFMEMSPARAAITGTAAIMAQCRMGQIQVRREPAIKPGTREQSHLPSTQPSGLNYEASVGLAAEG